MSRSTAASQRSYKVRRLTLTGVFSALIFVFTAYLHVPTGAGYTHAGDGLIYLAASILPFQYAAAAGAIGGGLADGLSGFVIWIPATILIKMITAFFFSNRGKTIITVRNILAVIPSLAVCVVGYSVYEGTVMARGFSAGAMAAAFAQTPAYLVQVGASTALYIAAGLALDKAGFKKTVRI